MNTKMNVKRQCISASGCGRQLKMDLIVFIMLVLIGNNSDVTMHVMVSTDSSQQNYAWQNYGFWNKDQQEWRLHYEASYSEHSKSSILEI